MNWDWIVKFAWVLIVEYIQNLPIIIGIVLGLAGMKKGFPWWKSLLLMAGSSYLCALIITSTEWIKVIPTTLTARPFAVLNALRLGTIFSVACVILLIYISLTGKLKRPYWADWVFGVVLGGLTAITESLNDIPMLLIVLHAVGFMAASGLLVTLIRYSSDAASQKSLYMRIGFITLLMTIMIAVFDYAPFIADSSSIAHLVHAELLPVVKDILACVGFS